MSNQRPPSRQDGALPLSYQGLVAGAGFEPAIPAYEAGEDNIAPLSRSAAGRNRTSAIRSKSPESDHQAPAARVSRPGFEPGAVALEGRYAVQLRQREIVCGTLESNPAHPV